MIRRRTSMRLLLTFCFTTSAASRSFSSYSLCSPHVTENHQKQKRIRGLGASNTAYRQESPRLVRRRPSWSRWPTDRDSSHVVAASTSSLRDGSQQPPLTYQDLSPVGRLVAGTVEVGIVTILEYISGMFGGYVLGSMTDIPRLLFRPVEGVPSARSWDQVSSRFVRLHQKSLRWGTSWAEISATCGGMHVACRVLRGGVEDEWNTLLGSMAAGAFFRRKEGLQAMLSGAVVYGALVYFLSGGIGKRKPFDYKEQPIEF